jgi:hypothetical protein
MASLHLPEEYIRRWPHLTLCVPYPINKGIWTNVIAVNGSSANQTGLLSAGDGVCSLGAVSSSKSATDLTSANLLFENVNYLHYLSLYNSAGVQQDSGYWVGQPGCYHERMEKENEDRNHREDWGRTLGEGGL